jgi:ribonuclease BN (tRNA processing enzyme)
MIKKLIVLGAGSAFTMQGRQVNFLFVDENNRGLMFDCGTDARYGLFRIAGMSYLDLDAVYISHLHSDHIGGLEWLALCTKFDPRCKSKIKLFIHEALVERLWNNCLSGGLQTLQVNVANLDTFFNVQTITKNGGFMWANTLFELIQTVHIVNGNSFEHSYGLKFKINDKTIFITSDTQYAPNQLKDFYKSSDVILHDCETMPFKSGVHAHYSELVTLDAEHKNKMWLYHYNDGELPDAEKDGFRGFLRQSQVFDFDNMVSLERYQEFMTPSGLT